MSVPVFRYGSFPPAASIDDLRRTTEANHNRLVDQLNRAGAAHPTDAGGARVTRVSDPSRPLDAVNLRTLEGRIADIDRVLDRLQRTEKDLELLYGLHSARPAAGAKKDGSLYFETDRDVLYQVETISGTHQWVYVAGMMSDTIANKPTDLGTNDTNFLFRGTDYSHTWRWTGSAWEWGVGETGSDFIQMCLSAPSGFGASAWVLATAGTNTYVKSDLTTATRVIPDLTAGVYPKMGAAVSTATVAPTAPTINANANTGATAPAVTVDSATTGVTAATGNAAIGTPSATTVVQSGAGATVASSTHNHTDSGHSHTINDTGHTHTGSVASHTHSIGSITANTDADMKNFILLPYYRR